MDQLETLGKTIEVPVFLLRGETDVFKNRPAKLSISRRPTTATHSSSTPPGRLAN